MEYENIHLMIPKATIHYARQAWVAAIDAEWRRGLSGWHLSLLAFQQWFRDMEKLVRLPRMRDGD